MSIKSCPIAAQIEIKVNTQYLQGRLPEEEKKYAFAYKIDISNIGNEQVQLIIATGLLPMQMAKRPKFAVQVLLVSNQL